jgi:hypothetical protein
MCLAAVDVKTKTVSKNIVTVQPRQKKCKIVAKLVKVGANFSANCRQPTATDQNIGVFDWEVPWPVPSLPWQHPVLTEASGTRLAGSLVPNPRASTAGTTS